MSIVARIDQDGNCPTCHRSMLIGRAPSPASGEGGSPSALRASAPEGIAAWRAEKWAREITRGCEDPPKIDLACGTCRPGGAYRVLGYRCAFHEALDYLQGRPFDHDASVSDGPSRGAPAPLAPEGNAAAKPFWPAEWSEETRTQCERVWQEMHANWMRSQDACERLFRRAGRIEGERVAAIARAEAAEKEVAAASEVRAAILRDHERMKQCAEAAEAQAGRMREALLAVIRVADRNTVEFDMARAALSPAPPAADWITVYRATADRAADHLDAEADCLRESHTISGAWPEAADEATREAKADHDSMRACAAALRAKP